MIENQAENDYKNEQMIRVKDQIEDLMNHGEGDEIIGDILYDISLQEVDQYLNDEYIKVNCPRFSSCTVKDEDTFNMLCDYMNIKIGDEYIHKNSSQKVYFIEGDQYALTLIPMQLKDKNINYRIEALENAPDFITEMYANLEEEKKSRKESKNDEYRIRFDKFGNRI